MKKVCLLGAGLYKKIYLISCIMVTAFSAHAINWSSLANNVGSSLATAGKVAGTVAVVGTVAALSPSTPYGMQGGMYGQQGMYGQPGMMGGYGNPMGMGITTVNGSGADLTKWGNGAMNSITPGLAPSAPGYGANPAMYASTPGQYLGSTLGSSIGGSFGGQGSVIGGMAGLAAASLMGGGYNSGYGNQGYGGGYGSPYGAPPPGYGVTPMGSNPYGYR